MLAKSCLPLPCTLTRSAAERLRSQPRPTVLLASCYQPGPVGRRGPCHSGPVAAPLPHLGTVRASTSAPRETSGGRPQGTGQAGCVYCRLLPPAAARAGTPTRTPHTQRLQPRRPRGHSLAQCPSCPRLPSHEPHTRATLNAPPSSHELPVACPPPPSPFCPRPGQPQAWQAAADTHGPPPSIMNSDVCPRGRSLSAHACGSTILPQSKNNTAATRRGSRVALLTCSPWVTLCVCVLNAHTCTTASSYASASPALRTRSHKRTAQRNGALCFS